MGGRKRARERKKVVEEAAHKIAEAIFNKCGERNLMRNLLLSIAVLCLHYTALAEAELAERRKTGRLV